MIVVPNNVLWGISPVVLPLRKRGERERESVCVCDRQTMIDLVDNLHTVNDKFSFMRKTTHDSFVRPEMGKILGQKSSAIIHDRLSEFWLNC
jgi:hypothetical protein